MIAAASLNQGPLPLPLQFASPDSNAVPVWFVTAESWPAIQTAIGPAATRYAAACGFEPKPGRLQLLPGNAELGVAAYSAVPKFVIVFHKSRSASNRARIRSEALAAACCRYPRSELARGVLHANQQLRSADLEVGTKTWQGRPARYRAWPGRQ